MIFASKEAVLTDGRQNTRYTYIAPCSVRRWGRTFPAMTRNISKGGICIDVQGMGSTTFGADLAITIRGFPEITATARWSHKRTFGLQFLDSIQDHPGLRGLIQELEGVA